MTENELKKLGRNELLQLMLDQGKEIEHLKEVIEDQKVKLEDHSIHIEKAGTIEEATVSVNSVLKEAEDQATEYLTNINRMIEEQEKYCNDKTRSTENKCAALKTITEERISYMKEDTQMFCNDLKKTAEEECAFLRKETDEKLARVDNANAARETVVTEKCTVLQNEAEEKCASLKKATEEICAAMTKQIDEECDSLIKNNEEICNRKIKAAEDFYESKIKKTDADVEARWKALTERLEAFYKAHSGLRELLNTDGNISR